MKPVLYIGNKNYSSWSLRPWLVLRWAGIAFAEKLIALEQPGYGKGLIEEVLSVSPSGRVPALHQGDLRIHDSLAIAEWAAEEAPDAGLWPADRKARSLARAVVCEMHSGFEGLRRDLPMNIHRRCAHQEWPADTQRNIERVLELFTTLRKDYGEAGPWLFGSRTIVDAFYAPVVTRLRTYSVPLPGTAAAYSATVLSDPDFKSWEAAGIPKSWDVKGFSVIDRMYASQED